MIIIADSGSTKTDWVILENGNRKNFSTIGFNPYFINSEQITKNISENFPKNLDGKKVEKVFFYGAGCSSHERCETVSKGLKKFFVNAEIKVSHDIEGAAIGLFGNSPGIALILGTGSNSCVYDGNKIVDNIPALGYILGDEGSGAFFGLQLVKDFLNKEMPEKLYGNFRKKYGFDREYILDRVYKKPLPNRFLAGFAPFLTENIDHPYIEKMITTGFELFFKRHVIPYKNYTQYNIGSIGSIGYYLAPFLKNVAHNYGFDKIIIMKSPLEGLVRYYQSIN